MKTSDLITLIAHDVPVRPDLNYALWHAAIAATVIAGIIFFSVIGFRPDIDTAVQTGGSCSSS